MAAKAAGTVTNASDEIAYYHIELASHDVILTEGAAAETFIDCDNRRIFRNACEFALLYPEEKSRRQEFYVPRITAGREFEAVRRRLRARFAVPQGRSSRLGEARSRRAG